MQPVVLQADALVLQISPLPVALAKQVASWGAQNPEKSCGAAPAALAASAGVASIEADKTIAAAVACLIKEEGCTSFSPIVERLRQLWWCN
jgi:hypothetical protein